MFGLIGLIAGTLLLVRYVTWYMAGKEYSEMLETLTESEYPAKELYRVGFAAQEKGLLKFGTERTKEIVSQATLLYGRKYAEFYARTAWAQGITLAMTLLIITCAVAANAPGNQAVYLLVGCVLAGALFWNSVTDMQQKLKKRQQACLKDFPEMISKLALLVNSGMTLRGAWRMVSESKEGELYTLMQETTDLMNNGTSEADALYLFGMNSNTPEIRKFASVITQGIEKGNSELAATLVDQSAELWALKRQMTLQQGEKAASALLLPIGLLFVGVLIIVIMPIFSNVL